MRLATFPRVTYRQAILTLHTEDKTGALFKYGSGFATMQAAVQCMKQHLKAFGVLQSSSSAHQTG